MLSQRISSSMVTTQPIDPTCGSTPPSVQRNALGEANAQGYFGVQLTGMSDELLLPRGPLAAAVVSKGNRRWKGRRVWYGSRSPRLLNLDERALGNQFDWYRLLGG
jgi:hypothetical protein